MNPVREDTSQVRLFHAAAKTRAVFDDEHVIAHGGLVPVMRLADRCRLPELVAEHVRIIDRQGVNAPAKISSIVAGMTAGADSIDDLDVLRHGGMTKLFEGVRAPSTLGSFLRCLRWGNVRQIEKVSRELLTRLATHTPLLPGADVLAFIDIDSTQKRVYGPGKQGAGFGHTKIQGKSVLIRGLNALAAVISTPLAAPVIAATRLRAGTTNSARGAASLIAEAIGVARQAGASGDVMVRGDSAFYSAACVHACLRQHAFFSFTVKIDPKVKAAVATIEEPAWTPIKYPNAIFDEETGTWVSNAEIAEIDYTAFASKKTTAVTARLIVRRVRRLNNAPRRATRTAARLAVSRGIHQQPIHLAPSREPAPRPRDHRASLRRSQRRATGPPAIRGLRRERRLAHPRRPHPQPATRLRLPGLRLPRQSPRPHATPTPDQCARPDHPPRPRPPHPAPARPLALGQRLDHRVHPHTRPTPANLSPRPPAGNGLTR
jgi:hypothetical protein